MDPSNSTATLSDLPWIDMVGIGLICSFLLLGIVRGLWWQVIRLAGVVLAVALARLVSPQLEPQALEVFPDLSPRLAYGIVWAAVFFLTLAVATLLGYLGRKLLQAVQLGLADRAGGALAGAITGATLHLAALAALVQLAPESWLKSTLPGSYSQEALAVVVDKWPVVVTHAAGADEQMQQILSEGRRTDANDDGSSVK